MPTAEPSPGAEGTWPAAGRVERCATDLARYPSRSTGVGRRVMAYDVLVRIADGLGMPRGYLGLAHTKDGGNSAYPEGDPSGVVEEVTDEMLRRNVLAKGSVALVGVPVLGKLLTSSAGPGEMGLPSQVGSTDVAEVKHTTDQLRVTARARGGQARAVSAAAAQYGRLLRVPASDAVRSPLGSELAALNNLAGWCCFDSGMDLHARWHYRTAIDLAHHVGDGYELSNAFQFSGIIDSTRGRPNDALKVYQKGQSLLGPKGDPESVSWLHALSANVLASMGYAAKAVEELAKARGGWQSPDQYLRADMDYQTALVYMELRRPDKVEQFGVNQWCWLAPAGGSIRDSASCHHLRAGRRAARATDGEVGD